MANKLYNLIENLTIKNQLKVFENSYIKAVDSNYCDISSEIVVDGHKYYGRGIDTNPDIAVKKAVFESIERSLIDFNKLENSNGIALSDLKHGAMESAKNEVLERHLFLYHWHNQLPYLYFENSLTIQLKKKFYLSFPSTIKIQFFHTLSWQLSSCYICVITGSEHIQRFGCIIGMGFNIDLNKSILHSFFEALSSLSHELNSGSIAQSHSLDEFSDIKNPSFKDHGKLAKNWPYFKKFQFLFPDSEKKLNMHDINSCDLFQFKDLKIPVECELYGIRCSNDSLFTLYTGFSNLINKNNYPHLLD